VRAGGSACSDLLHRQGDASGLAGFVQSGLDLFSVRLALQQSGEFLAKA
jgi:hypothetical protein